MITFADISSVQRPVVRSEEFGFAFVTVNALRIMTTILTNSSAFVQSVDIQRKAQAVNIRIVLTLISMAETVAGYKVRSVKLNSEVRVHDLTKVTYVHT